MSLSFTRLHALGAGNQTDQVPVSWWLIVSDWPHQAQGRNSRMASQGASSVTVSQEEEEEVEQEESAPAPSSQRAATRPRQVRPVISQHRLCVCAVEIVCTSFTVDIPRPPRVYSVAT
jgi:hypothetical protein